MAIRENIPVDERQGQTGGRVLVVCTDLFFSSQLAGVVRGAGFDPVPELQTSRAAGQLATGEWAGVVVDVEATGLDIANLIAGLGNPPRPRVVAFGPHVHVARLEAAEAAGCDVVLTRGQISSNPKRLRAALLGTNP